MNVLVTGGAGFIGVALVERLVAGGHFVADADLGDFFAAAAVHLAARADVGAFALWAVLALIHTDYRPPSLVTESSRTCLNRTV